MALPINSSTPVYTLTVPSSNIVVKFRPFLIKEEKALLIAQQSEDPIVMVNSLKQVIKSCLQTEVDVDDFATFDIEYIFTQMRAKSVGEIVDLSLKCDTCVDEKAVSNIKINLTEVTVDKPENHTNKIKLFDDVGVVLKYPSLETILKFESVESNNIDQLFNIVVDCIDYIYNSEEVFHAKEQTKSDLMDFLNNLSSDQFTSIQSFFETMPKLKKEITYKCPVCKTEHKKTLEGISSFF